MLREGDCLVSYIQSSRGFVHEIAVSRSVVTSTVQDETGQSCGELLVCVHRVKVVKEVGHGATL